MQFNYNPFKKKQYEKTPHGVINYMMDMGTCYVTHRRKEHFFKKYHGFAISLSELVICYDKKVYWIIIMYHRDDGTSIPYRIELSKLQFFEEYDNNGDVQKVIPLKNLRMKIDDNWVIASG